MASDWESVLGSLDESSTSIGESVEVQVRTALSEDSLNPLRQTAILQISGDDKTAYCQGQFTNDITQVNARHSQLSAFCSPKGRMLACFRVFQKDENYYVSLPVYRAAATLQRLRLFVLRAKVTLGESNWLGLGLSGPNAAALLADCLGQAAPAAINTVVATDNLCAIQIPGPLPRFELYGTADAVKTCAQILGQNTRIVGADAWTLLDIRAGLPSVHESTADAFVPQMANLDLLDGISFRKGCYVGQEIVARMHYLGRLKRRMFRLWLDNNTPPAPGTDLFAPERRGEQSIGQIVNAAPSPEGGSEALAVLTLECLGAALQLADRPADRIELRQLPYTIPENKPNHD